MTAFSPAGPGASATFPGHPRPFGAGGGAWIPTEAVACHAPVVPAVPRRKWQGMIPWLLEDQLLEPLERLHLAWGDRDPEGVVPVLAVNRELLARWQQGAPGPLVPDAFALPWHKGECALAVEGDRWLLRAGPWQLAAGPAALLAPLVARLLGDGGLQLVVYGPPGSGDLPPDLAAGARWRDRMGLFDRPRGPFLACAGGPGEQRQSAALPRGARVAAGLGALAALLLALGSAVETSRLSAEADHLEGQLRAAHQRYLGQPYDFPMADFQAVVSRQLGGGEGSGALDLVAAVAPAVAACRGCAVERLAVADGAVELRLAAGAEAVAALPRAGASWRAALSPEGEGWSYRVVPVGEEMGGLDHE